MGMVPALVCLFFDCHLQVLSPVGDGQFLFGWDLKISSEQIFLKDLRVF
jgi:hypothetical protein